VRKGRPTGQPLGNAPSSEFRPTTSRSATRSQRPRRLSGRSVRC